MYKTKKEVLVDYPELELTDFGDFRVKEEYTKDYGIIDCHCHLFTGLKELFPRILKKEKEDMEASLFDGSCFPFSLKTFNLEKVCFTDFPDRLMSIDGIRAKYKLQAGGLVVQRATVKRLLRDMKLNNISKSVVLQINPPNRNAAGDMNYIVNQNKELMTFGAINPKDSNIQSKINQYSALDIKGWKVNPHVCGFDIDSSESINLLKELSSTNMPVLSCSGAGVPEQVLKTAIFSKKQKREMQTQNLKRFYQVLKEIPNTAFILAHGGIFETDELIELMKHFPNTYTDISTQPSRNIQKLIQKVGSERLLFGTDYPFFNQAFSIVSVLRATSTEEERKNIFSKNANRLLNM